MISLAKKTFFYATALLTLLIALPFALLLMAHATGGYDIGLVYLYSFWLFGLYVLGPALTIALLGLLITTLMEKFKRKKQ